MLSNKLDHCEQCYHLSSKTRLIFTETKTTTEAIRKFDAKSKRQSSDRLKMYS